MQSITALAHLKSCVMYLIDPSEQCSHSIYEQIQPASEALSQKCTLTASSYL